MPGLDRRAEADGEEECERGSLRYRGTYLTATRPLAWCVRPDDLDCCPSYSYSRVQHGHGPCSPCRPVHFGICGHPFGFHVETFFHLCTPHLLSSLLRRRRRSPTGLANDVSLAAVTSQARARRCLLEGPVARRGGDGGC